MDGHGGEQRMKEERKTKQQLIGDLEELRQQLAALRRQLDGQESDQSPGERLSFLRSIVENSITGIYIYDLVQGNNVYLNPQYTRLTGFTLDQVNALLAEVSEELKLG